MNDETWLMVDGNSWAHTDYHGSGGPEGCYDLARARLSLIREQFRTARVFVAFDSSSPTFRHERFPGYKAGRVKKPGVAVAIANTMMAVTDEGAQVAKQHGFEADDLIASLVHLADERGCRSIIASADKDLHQCLQKGRVCQIVSARRDFGRLRIEWRNWDGITEKYGVRPDQWIDYRAMIGDPSDNLKGVDGIGPVAAKAVLNACGSLDRFYDDPFAAPLTEVQRGRMVRSRKHVAFLRELITLRVDAPVESLVSETL